MKMVWDGYIWYTHAFTKTIQQIHNLIASLFYFPQKITVIPNK